MARKVTLAHIASRAEVSIGTVSKVLNRRPGVGVEVRSRVLRAARSLEYEPRNTGVQPRRSVLVTFDALNSIYPSLLLAGAIAAAERLDFNVLVSTQEALEKERRDTDFGMWLTQANRAIDGLILVTSPLAPDAASKIHATGIPAVAVDPANSISYDIMKVGATNWAGGVSATTHLIERGHNRIAHIAGPVLSVAAAERHEGYKTALATHGINYRHEFVSTAAFSYEGGLVAGAALLSLDERPTAIFAACDATALGVLEAARRAGLRVPEDLSVVGFDDTEVAQHSSPPLTTVRQPIRDMGAVAMEAIAALLEDPAAVPKRIQLETELVVRSSTAPPPR